MPWPKADVAYTGGFSPQDSASATMRFIATGDIVFGIPTAHRLGPDRLWYGVPVHAHHLRPRHLCHRQSRTRRLSLGRRHSAHRDVRLRDLRRPVGARGVLLAGYASHAAQAMGDPYLLQSIAAVVLGGTSILGGRGSYLGTVAGVILITLLQSILSVMQMEEFGRQVIYGVVIIVMLLLYGRERLLR